MDNLLVIGKNAIKTFMNQKLKRLDEYQKKQKETKRKRFDEDCERDKEDLELVSKNLYTSSIGFYIGRVEIFLIHMSRLIDFVWRCIIERLRGVMFIQ